MWGGGPQSGNVLLFFQVDVFLLLFLNFVCDLLHGFGIACLNFAIRDWILLFCNHVLELSLWY